MSSRRSFLKIIGIGVSAGGVLCKVPSLILPGGAHAAELILPDDKPPVIATFEDMTKKELQAVSKVAPNRVMAEQKRRAADDFEARISWVSMGKGELRDTVEGLIHSAKNIHGATGFQTERFDYGMELRFRVGPAIFLQ